MKAKRFTSALAILVASLTTVDILRAQTFWNAGTGNWFTSGNWTLGVPNASSSTTFDAVIANGGTSQIQAAGGSVRRLRVGRHEGPGHLLVDAGTLNVTENLHLNEGFVGHASMTVQSGSTVASPSIVVGYASDVPTDLLITGAGSMVTTNEINVGRAGTGTGNLTIKDGGRLSGTDGFIGRFALSSGSAFIGGLGSTWTNSGVLRVGHIGNGTFTVAGGGSVSDDFGYIAVSDGSVSSATVTGAGSNWSNTSTLFVGYEGEGTLNVEAGGGVASNAATIGQFGSSTGTVMISGPDSTWTDSDGLLVGDGGLGSFRVTAGATATSVSAVIGNAVGSSGNATVDAPDSIWTVNGPLHVGYQGAGSLIVAGGGRITQTSFGSSSVGAKDGGYGNITIQGAGSAWSTDNALILGGDGAAPTDPGGDGYMTVRDGAQVVTNTGYVAYGPGSNSGVSVEGTGATWTTNQLLSVGTKGTGYLHITSGGTVYTNSGDANIGGSFGSTGSGSVLVDGAGSALILPSTGPSGLYIGDDGPGSLTVSNGGTVSVASFNGVYIDALGIVTGNGTLNARVYNYGTVAPGTSIGTLTIVNNPYRQAPTGTLEIELASVSSYDRLIFPDGGAALEGGTLEVKLLGGYSPSAGNSFDLMDWSQFGSITGTFDTLNLPDLPGTLDWDTSQLYSAGVLLVIDTSGLPGDFNHDGTVNAADYIAWQKGVSVESTPANYNLWLTNFGRNVGSGSGSSTSPNTSVPEPAAWWLALSNIVATFSVRRTSCKSK